MSNINGLFGAEPEDYLELPSRKTAENILTLALGFPASWNNLYGI